MAEYKVIVDVSLVSRRVLGRLRLWDLDSTQPEDH